MTSIRTVSLFVLASLVCLAATTACSKGDDHADHEHHEGDGHAPK